MIKSTQFAMLLFTLFVSISTFAGNDTGTVEVTYSSFLEKRMDRISALDKQREIAFRKYRTDGARMSLRPKDLLNNGRLSNTEWGNERLIPDIDNYSVPALIAEMMERGVNAAHPDGFEGRVVLDVEKMRVENFPLAVINSHNSRMEGTIKVFDNAGELVSEHRIRTTLIPKFTASTSYDGYDYAYLPTAGATRIGPIAAEFTAKALETAFPEFDAPDPIFVQL